MCDIWYWAVLRWNYTQKRYHWKQSNWLFLTDSNRMHYFSVVFAFDGNLTVSDVKETRNEMKTIIIKSKTMLRVADIFILFDSNRNGATTDSDSKWNSYKFFFSSSKRNNINKSRNRSPKFCEIFPIYTKNWLNGSDLFGSWRNLKSIIMNSSLMEHNQHTLGNTLCF